MRFILFFSLAIFLVYAPSYAQDEEYPYPSLSPKGKISQIVGNTELTLDVRKTLCEETENFRQLWYPGIKYGETGAGHCTKIRFSKEVVLEGQRYSRPAPILYLVFRDPRNGLSSLIQILPSMEVTTTRKQMTLPVFVVIPTPAGRFFETLTFDIDLVPNNARIYLSWTDVQVSFLVETSTDRLIEDFIQTELMTGKESRSNLYAGASEYFLYQGKNYSGAIFLTEKSPCARSPKWLG